MKRKKKSFNPIIIAVIVVLLFSFFVTHKSTHKVEEEAGKIVREPVVAGTFYPSGVSELESMLNTFFEKAEKKELKGEVKGLVVPHAGYIYSGQVVAEGFKQISNSVKTVIVLAPTHSYPFSGASVGPFTQYKTSLGEIKVSEKAKGLAKEKGFSSIKEAHLEEHSLEVELPFLQKVLGKNFEIIPIVVGEANPQELANVLAKYVDASTLVVASSDLSHYHSYEEAQRLDKKCTDAITTLNFEGMTDCEACGKIPILTLMYLAQYFRWGTELISYKNSGDTAGDKSKVVGYSSIMFYEEGLSKEDKALLIKLARDTIKSYLKEGKKAGVDESKLSANLLKEQGCFVTLEKHGELRGCIGHIIPQESLYKCIIGNAINAAVNDPRFPPTIYEELGDIEIEVSVLTVPQKLPYDSSEDLLNKLRPNIDGVVIKSGWHQSTYLPQVWEQITQKEDFLSSLCRKGGANANCWKDKSTVVETYQAVVFKESE